MQHKQISCRLLSQPCGALRGLALFLGCLTAAFCAGCGHSGEGGATAQNPGDFESNPTTGKLYIVDENQSGEALDFSLVEVLWGRLVDVHQLMDDSGVIPQVTDPAPLFTDFVINETIVSTLDEYVLETNPITHRMRLVVLARRDSTDAMEALKFDTLLRATQDSFPVIEPKSDLFSEPGPFSIVARNACLILRFNDLINDDATAVASLVDNVRVLAGQPPISLQATRIFFDPNHGATVGGQFHSTRVLVDASISTSELPGAQPNLLGFPARSTSSERPNVSIRIPTRTNFGVGQFRILRNLVGNSIDPNLNEPVDFLSLTEDVVRGMRSGNRVDLNNGFLADSSRPDLLGTFAVNFDTVSADPMGTAGLDFVADISFQSACEAQPQLRDILVVNTVSLEVVELGGMPMGGVVTGVKCRAAAPVGAGITLTGLGQMWTRFDPAFVGGGTTEECWVSFTPTPAALPSTQVLSQADIVVRFSEAMDTASMSSFDNFMVVRGVGPMNENPPDPLDLIVGVVVPGADLDVFSLDPTLALDHVNLFAETYHVRLRGVTDLAGNPLTSELPFTNFQLEPTSATLRTGGISLRFPADNDELDDPAPDFRGQVLSVVGEDTLQGRPPIVRTEEIHPNHPVTSQMLSSPDAFAPTGQPFNPLGVRMQKLWRYVDLGFSLLDESKYDIDIIGMSWAAATGGLMSEFYESFEMRLAHSKYQPDEGSALLGTQPNPTLNTGLGASDPAGPFSDNVFVDPDSPQMIVHSRNLGYSINSLHASLSPNGQTLVPYPLDPLAGGDVIPPETFTWRNTAALGVADPIGVGIPLSIEADLGIAGFSPLPPHPPLSGGGIRRQGNVPTIGLPLLIEIWTFPTTTALGLTRSNVGLPLGFPGPAPATVPGYRTISSGFTDGAGFRQEVNPDLSPVPTGEPGVSAPTDNLVYFGAIDTIAKWSRIHSVWIDAGAASNWLLPIVSPLPSEQPPGTEVRIEVRGSFGFFNPLSEAASLDASTLDPYGNFWDGTLGVNFLNGESGWTDEFSDIDGARYIQLRISFKNNISTRVSPTITSLGLPFQN